MNAVAVQDHISRRARLGMPVTPVRRVRISEVVTVKPRSEVLMPWGVPVNLLDCGSPRTILKFVGLRHGVSVGEITGPSRTIKMVDARNHAIALIYTHCRRTSLPEIGKIFRRDHTTILHSLQKMRRAGTTLPAPYRLQVIPTIHAPQHGHSGITPKALAAHDSQGANPIVEVRSAQVVR